MSINLPVKRTRQERINRLLELIRSGVSNETLAKFCLEEGITWRTIQEYLKLLKLGGKIE